MPEAIGGVRFLLSDVNVKIASIAGGSLIVIEANTGASADSVVYDGLADGMVNSNNLGGIDLTANGNDRVEFTVTALTGTATVFIAFNNCFVNAAVDATGTFHALFDQSGQAGNDCSAQAASLTALRLAFAFDAVDDSITLASIGATGPAQEPAAALPVPAMGRTGVWLLVFALILMVGFSLRRWS